LCGSLAYLFWTGGAKIFAPSESVFQYRKKVKDVIMYVALALSGVGDPHHSDADPDPACHCDADSDPTFHYDAEINPTFQFGADPDDSFQKSSKP
jgi:hypothetical protein